MSSRFIAAEGLCEIDCRRALDDSALPWLRTALDPSEIGRWITPVVARAEGRGGKARLLEARLVRHKPGRRCVVYYEFDVGRRLGIYGKIRARGADHRTHTLLRAFESAALDHAAGTSRVGVPRAIAVVPELNLTLQCACPGAVVTPLLEQVEGVSLMQPVAEALFGFHRAGVEARRSHAISDELAILRSRLTEAAALAPIWRERIEQVLEACCEIASRLDLPQICGIHRDFYSDQVLVDGSTVTLLDLDLFAAGDPALDVGNFSAHLTELSMRVHATPDRFAAHEKAFEERYLALAPEVPRESIRIYRILTLARHVHLSMTLPGRAAVTGDLLEYCEAQLGLARAESDQKLSRTRSVRR